MSVVAMILISAFGAIAVLFLADAIIIVEPYFRQWLQRELDRTFEPRECASCKHCATDFSVRPPRHYCNMVGKNITEDSSCDRWEKR